MPIKNNKSGPVLSFILLVTFLLTAVPLLAGCRLQSAGEIADANQTRSIPSDLMTVESPIITTGQADHQAAITETSAVPTDVTEPTLAPTATPVPELLLLPAEGATQATAPAAPARTPTKAPAPITPKATKATPTPAPAPPTEPVQTAAPTTSGTASTQSWLDEVFRLTNMQRSANGLSELQPGSAAMLQAAAVRATEISVQFDHIRPDGRSCFTVFDDFGIPFSCVGENIAAGQPTPEAVVDAWMNSEGHRKNILSADYTSMAVGFYALDTAYKTYIVQIFAG